MHWRIRVPTDELIPTPFVVHRNNHTINAWIVNGLSAIYG